MKGQTVQSCAGRSAGHLAPDSRNLADHFSVCAPMQLPPAVMAKSGVGYMSLCQHKLLQDVQEVNEDQTTAYQRQILSRGALQTCTKIWVKQLDIL